MQEFLKKNIPVFFSFIIFGGLLWGISGFGFLIGKNWNIINLLFKNNIYLEAAVYIIIAVNTLTKTIYNIIWERPQGPPHMMFIITAVVVSGFVWGIVGFVQLTGMRWNPLTPLNAASGVSRIPGIIAYTIGIFTFIKLFNFIYTHKGAEVIRTD